LKRFSKRTFDYAVMLLQKIEFIYENNLSVLKTFQIKLYLAIFWRGSITVIRALFAIGFPLGVSDAASGTSCAELGGLVGSNS
jgi:hypothetical protein